MIMDFCRGNIRKTRGPRTYDRVIELAIKYGVQIKNVYVYRSDPIPGKTLIFRRPEKFPTQTRRYYLLTIKSK